MISFVHLLAYNLDRDAGAIPPKLPNATIVQHARTSYQLHPNDLVESRIVSVDAHTHTNANELIKNWFDFVFNSIVHTSFEIRSSSSASKSCNGNFSRCGASGSRLFTIFFFILNIIESIFCN